jgi:uncharacterized protein YkwD
MSMTNPSNTSRWRRRGIVVSAAVLALLLDVRSEISGSISVASWFLLGAVAEAQMQPNWTVVEQDIITEHNRVRQNPRSYVPLLEAYMARMDAQGNIPNGCGPDCTRRTQEGRAAVQEAINFLRKQRVLGPVVVSNAVAQASKAHAQDQAGGSIGHTGTDGSGQRQRLSRVGATYAARGENIAYGATVAKEVLMSLIIDDGVPGRGHRQNIFLSNWTQAGAGCGRHAVYGSVCVIGYINASQNSSRSSGASATAGGAQSTTAGATSNRLTIVHGGTVDLRSVHIRGTDILGGALSPGNSRNIALDANQCQADLRLQLGGAYGPVDWPGLTLCGATLSINGQNRFELQLQY